MFSYKDIVNGLPMSNTIKNFVGFFICCPIDLCIIGEFTGRQLKIPISMCSPMRYASETIKQEGKGMVSAVEEEEGGEQNRQQQ